MAVFMKAKLMLFITTVLMVVACSKVEQQREEQEQEQEQDNNSVKHFPSTEEEQTISLDLASTIANSIEDLFGKQGFYDGNITVKDIISSIKAIKGVSDAYTTSNDEYLIIKQEDGLHFNIPLLSPAPENGVSYQTECTINAFLASDNNPSRSPSSYNKRALLLLPYYSGVDMLREIEADIKTIRSYLTPIDCSLDYCVNGDVTREKCTSDVFSNYDLLLIGTHGGIDLVDTEGKRILATVLSTGEKEAVMTYKKLRERSNNIKWYENLAIQWVQRFFYYNFSVVDLGENAQYDNSIVYAMACHSYELSDLADYFMKHGCAAYCGNAGSIHTSAMDDGLEHFVEYLSKGLSVSDAAMLVKSLSSDPFGYNIPIKSSTKNNEPVFLVNPTPFNLNASVDNIFVTVSWDVAKTNGDYQYDVYCDEALIQANVKSTSCLITVDTPGTHEWYVVAKLQERSNMFIFRSETSSFTTIKHPYAVDLGLSVKWASCNVGATSPEEYGNYYAWGETEHKKYYTEDTYLWGKIGAYTKYNYESLYGKVDNKRALDQDDDVACVKWGSGWRMPTINECRELLDNCKTEWFYLNGKNGYKITSNIPGHTDQWIFLPSAGYYTDYYHNDYGLRGYYWSSTLSDVVAYDACYLSFYYNYLIWAEGSDGRYRGQSVRPVCPQAE